MQNAFTYNKFAADPPRVRVCVGIITADGRVLIGRRPAGKRLAGFWEFPGGKLQAPESPEACLHRELREELGVEVVIEQSLPPIVRADADLIVELLAFHCRLAPLPTDPANVPISVLMGRVRPLANDELRWVQPAELPDYRFPPANDALIEMLSGEC